MDSIDFTLATGFPLDEAQLDFLQQAYTKSFLGLGKFIGGSDPDTVYILQGCDNFAGITNNGFIVLAGEILPFIGGPTLPNIIITEESLAGLVYQDGVTRFPRHRRFASFGTGADQKVWQPDNRLDDDSSIPLIEKIKHHTHAWTEVTGKPTFPTVKAGVINLSPLAAGAIQGYTITFPVAMPSAAYSLTVTIVSRDTGTMGGPYYVSQPYAKTASGFHITAQNQGSAAAPFEINWIAVLN